MSRLTTMKASLAARVERAPAKISNAQMIVDPSLTGSSGKIVPGASVCFVVFAAGLVNVGLHHFFTV